MGVKALGHAVLRVRELERSLAFYRDLLGLKEVARYGSRMVFLSCGENHHDLALQQIGKSAPDPNPAAVGLYHLAFKVGDNLQDLVEVKKRLEAASVRILGTSDHDVSKSLYVLDPDGIEIELYSDEDPAIWRSNPHAVATIKPLAI
ncbi:MAG TPA: VOC family protein [Candidatus Methylomirabilis sp.]|nr:VOC family protein [Candidatus Methylomirabilis sp.]HSD49941.1 VOC family protein [Candidatus Methylomirabilis sp.]